MGGRIWRVVKQDHLGQATYSYPGVEVRREGDALVLRCVWTALKSFAVGDFALADGDIFLEWFWPERWFNVFDVCSAAGERKGWYCNVTYPPAIGDGEVRWRDLALDLLLLPDGGEVLLDVDEFEALGPTDDERRHAAEALETLRGWRRHHRGPFALAGGEG